MDEKRKTGGWMSGLLVIGVIFVIVFIIDAGISSVNKCFKTGCNNPRAHDSIYCDTHKSYARTTKYREDVLQTYGADTGGGSTPGTTNYRSNTSTYSGGGSGNKPSGSRSTTRTRTYNTLNNDPVDYDDPEDYADDAWGDDFDDWGDAYDYWEDY